MLNTFERKSSPCGSHISAPNRQNPFKLIWSKMNFGYFRNPWDLNEGLKFLFKTTSHRLSGWGLAFVQRWLVQADCAYRGKCLCRHKPQWWREARRHTLASAPAGFDCAILHCHLRDIRRDLLPLQALQVRSLWLHHSQQAHHLRALRQEALCQSQRQWHTGQLGLGIQPRQGVTYVKDSVPHIKSSCKSRCL